MNLYLTPSGYVRTQAEAKRLGGTGEVTDVPATSKDGMIEFLNGMLEKHKMDLAETAIQYASLSDEPEPVRPEPVTIVIPNNPPKPMTAGAVLSRMDSPGVDVEACVEAIAKSKGYALKRYAGAVAVRFQELAGA